MVYFNTASEMAVVFAVICCQMCHHAGGEKTASFPVF